MKKALKEKWIKALRSGKYTQAVGSLRAVKDDEIYVNGQFKRRGIGFCCLGVLCDVVEPDGWRGRRGHTSSVVAHNLGQRGGFLSNAALVDLGLRKFETGVSQKALAMLNDGGSTFDEIADFIDANLKTED